MFHGLLRGEEEGRVVRPREAKARPANFELFGYILARWSSSRSFEPDVSKCREAARSTAEASQKDRGSGRPGASAAGGTACRKGATVETVTLLEEPLDGCLVPRSGPPPCINTPCNPSQWAGSSGTARSCRRRHRLRRSSTCRLQRNSKGRLQRIGSRCRRGARTCARAHSPNQQRFA